MEKKDFSTERQNFLGGIVVGNRIEPIKQQGGQAVKQQMAELAETLEVLNYKCWYYGTAVNAGSEQAVKGLSKAELPRQFQKAKAKLEITEKE